MFEIKIIVHANKHGFCYGIQIQSFVNLRGHLFYNFNFFIPTIQLRSKLKSLALVHIISPKDFVLI